MSVIGECGRWVKAHPLAVGDDLVRTARKAVENIKNGESSELAQLWSESDETAEVWHADLGDLLRRLEQQTDSDRHIVIKLTINYILTNRNQQVKTRRYPYRLKKRPAYAGLFLFSLGQCHITASR